MRAAAEGQSDILSQDAHISSLATANGETEVRRRPRVKRHRPDADFASWARDLDALAGIFVIVATLIFEGGVARRNLRYASDESRQDCLDVLPGHRHVVPLQHVAFGIACSRGGAKANGRGIGFV